ncbi:MAG: S8 family serine peptidase [Pyrinomonadaceae bacterium]
MWRASLMSLRILDNTGTGDIASAIEAIDYASENGAHVINASWGTEADSLFLKEAIDRAGTKGVVVVCSAGNSARDLNTEAYYPASYDLLNLISVASTDGADQLASFSSTGHRARHHRRTRSEYPDHADGRRLPHGVGHLGPQRRSSQASPASSSH